MKRKLVITGGSGFLAYHLMRRAADWEVFVTTRADNLALPNNVALVHADVANYIEIGDVIDDIEPDAIIHAAAISDANFCEQNPEKSLAVNVDATRNLAGICCDLQIPFVFTSSDLVFDGKQGMYREDDERNPLSVYGQHKALAEDEVLKIYPEALVLRLPLMFGALDAGSGNYLQKFIAQLKRGERAKLFYDEYRSVCGAWSIAQGILQLIDRAEGLLHLAGAERLSRFDFGLLATHAFGLSPELIERVSQRDVAMAAPRPADVSLNIDRARAFGYAPMQVEEELKTLANHKIEDCHGGASQ